MLKIKQYFCEHVYRRIGEHEHTQQNLYQCRKCEVFYIKHYGIGISYKCKTPNIGGWKPVKT